MSKFFRFLLNMAAFPEMVRNVAVVGHLHHGKTALMDMVVFETHKMVWDSDKNVSYRPFECLLNAQQERNSYDIPTPMSCRESAKFLSSRHQCL